MISYPLSSAVRHPSSAIRRRPPAFLLSSFVFGLCLLLLPACTKRETDVEAGIRTQTLLIGNGVEPVSLDPHVTSSLNDACIFMALFEGLTALDEQTTRAVPAVAERWDVSPDGLVYTFQLRPSARWSNGDSVTASDFAFAFQRILKPEFGARYAYMLHPIKNAEAFNTGKIRDFSAVGVAAVDAHTLRLTLERPTPHLPALAAHMTWLPLHRPTLEKLRAVDNRTAPWARPGTLVGNGPFTLAEWRADVHVVVQKNPRYWDAARNRLERIVFLPTEKTEVEELNFRAGQTHVTFGLPTAKIAVYREREPARLRLEPLFDTFFLRFNVTKAPCDNQKVRRALALAIDRTGIVRAVFADSRRPAGHLTPPDCGGYNVRARVPTDFATARRLLAEAGFPAGRGLLEVEIQTNNTAERRRIAEVIQETWRRELGVRSTIASMEGRVSAQYQRTLDYSVAIGDWVADIADPVNFLEVYLGKGGNNWTGWSNPEYDRLIAEAARTLDPERRFEFFQQAEALLLEEAPIAPLFFGAQTYLIHPAVKGWVPAPLWVRRYQYVWLEK
ncbi:MAG: peptide ABC transporter substrate-binding protein [Opitutaceae bacterium]|nr:peptide ABC transporter substrate-binding protein [Opitutaceae bacterium]